MKNILLSGFLTALLIVPIEKNKVVDNPSAIQFSIKNFGIAVTGNFDGPEGKIFFDPKNVTASFFNVSVKSSSVNTGNELRDNHLKNKDYFDAEHYPAIAFVSDKITQSKNGTYTANGTLTIKNHAKAVQLPFTAEVKNGGYDLAGKFAINRKDFDIGGASIIADSAFISLHVYISNNK